MATTAGARAALARVPAPVVDAGLALAVAAANVAVITVATEPGSRRPDLVAYGLGVSYGVLALGRRRWPLGVLLASTLALLAYYTLNYPGVPPAVPLALTLFSAAVAGHLRWGLLITGMFMVAGFVVVWFKEGEPLLSVLTSFLQQAGLLVALLLLGEAVRSRRAWQAEVRERLARVEAERELDAARRVERERLRIARELHDVLAHTIAVIIVQASVAADVLGSGHGQARDTAVAAEALGAIRAASREAMAELQATVGVLRAGDGQAAPLAPSPGLAQLGDLVAAARAGGLAVEVVTDGDPVPLPAAVDLTAYRIVQESLTNVGRHARAARATVRLGYRPGALAVEVDDDGAGAGPAGGSGGGFGLTGMAERAEALGGRFEAGRRPGGGFRVGAVLPIGGRPG
jgi:signal transduction histidine kinase